MKILSQFEEKLWSVKSLWGLWANSESEDVPVGAALTALQDQEEEKQSEYS